MKKNSILIFGQNEYSLEIAKSISDTYEDLHVFALSDEAIDAKMKEFNLSFFDLSDEWDELSNNFEMRSALAFCALEDDAQNIFLTISLRACFSDLRIIALSKNKESANKLNMAGANKVIPIVQTTADIIVDILQKPMITEVLHNILYERSGLKIAQIRVEDYNYFDGKYPSDIEWSTQHGIIVLSIMHDDMKSEFIYSSKSKHHPIKKGDIFIVVGYDEDIDKFEKLIGSRCD